MLDLLSGNGITFKNCNFHCTANYAILAPFKKWATGGPNNELNQSKAHFFSDRTNNTPPQVSFITEAPPDDRVTVRQAGLRGPGNPAGGSCW